MFELLGLALFALVTAGAHTTARRFVRERLRFVDAVLRPPAPWVAMAATALVAMPLFALLPLPFFTAVSGVVLAASVGLGVRAGARDIGSGRRYLPDA
jgi:hypothetical protein